MKAIKRTMNVEPKASHELHVRPIPIGKSKESWSQIKTSATYIKRIPDNSISHFHSKKTITPAVKIYFF